MVGRNTSIVNTHPDANAPQAVVVSQPSVKIEAYVRPVKLTFHLVTAEQIDTYAQMGHLAQLFLTLFGLASGAAIGFWTALNQGELSPAGNATLNTAMRAAVIGLVIALSMAALFYCLQRKHKREWVTTTLPTH